MPCIQDFEIEFLLHDQCRNFYYEELEKQEELLKQLQLEFNGKLPISTLEDFDTKGKMTIPKTFNEAEFDCDILIDSESNYVTEIYFNEFKDFQNAYRIFQIISQFPHVKHLELTGLGDLGFIPIDFGNYYQLEELILDNINFSFDFKQSKLSSSVKLVLLDNISETLAELVINALNTNLDSIGIRSVPMTVIPEALFTIIGLTDLEIANTSISIVPPAIRNLHRLKILELQDNKIVSLPQSFSELKHLEQLDVSNNQLTNCAMIYELGKLRTLDISNNAISDITTICSLNSLKFFQADNNDITYLPFSFHRLISLTDLSLAGNFIINVREISKFKGLNSLQIGFEINLQNLDALGTLTFLKTLIITNELNIVPNTLLKITTLEFLILNIVKEKIPEFIFDLPNIKYIGLYTKNNDPTLIFARNLPAFIANGVLIDEYFILKFKDLSNKFENVTEF